MGCCVSKAAIQGAKACSERINFNGDAAKQIAQQKLAELEEVQPRASCVTERTAVALGSTAGPERSSHLQTVNQDQTVGDRFVSDG
jgi:hypothetical protein